MRISVVALVIAALASTAAQGAVTIEINEVGGDVVATASGSINTAGFDSMGSSSPGARVLGTGFNMDWTCGVAVGAAPTADVYFSADFGNPDVCSTGDRFAAFDNTGTFVGVTATNNSTDAIYVESGYVSGDPINATSTWTGASYASLGLVSGTYVYNWGSGADADSLTVIINAPTTVPPPASAPSIPIPSLQAIGTLVLALSLLAVAWVRLRP